jgi:L-iditol 2-dehydrogenase
MFFKEKKMKALVKYAEGPGKMEIRDVPVPVIGKRDVLIRLKAVGVCGTDTKIYNGHFPTTIPVIVGHEFAGVIEKVGEEVCGFSPGEPVVSEQHTFSCGNCRMCLTGQRHLCSHKRPLGYVIDGAFAEYISIPANLLHRIPEGVSFLEAAVIEPMAVAAYGILEKAKILPEDYVVILGCGPIAMLALQIVRAQGASRVVMTGIDSDAKKRFGIAKEYGAYRTINTMAEDPVSLVMADTGGTGADVVIDLSGSPQAIVQGCDLLRKDGRFCAMGIPSQDVQVPWNKLIFKAINVYFCYSSDFISWERCLSMIKWKKVQLAKFTQNVYELDQWEKAFTCAQGGEALKVIISIN